MANAKKCDLSGEFYDEVGTEERDYLIVKKSDLKDDIHPNAILDICPKKYDQIFGELIGKNTFIKKAVVKVKYKKGSGMGSQTKKICDIASVIYKENKHKGMTWPMARAKAAEQLSNSPLKPKKWKYNAAATHPGEAQSADG